MTDTHDTAATRDVLAERARQIADEDWTHEHDDQHDDGSLASAAACYASPIQLTIDGAGVVVEPVSGDEILPLGWPESWDSDWWKPSDRRRDLVKAAALILAEIERIDRAALKGGAK
jgi:hypothetical protein